MHTAHHGESASNEAVDVFQNIIEERYSEWEREFGAEVDARRTVAFDPKK
jgi:hypothetical protein